MQGSVRQCESHQQLIHICIFIMTICEKELETQKIISYVIIWKYPTRGNQSKTKPNTKKSREHLYLKIKLSFHDFSGKETVHNETWHRSLKVKNLEERRGSQ